MIPQWQKCIVKRIEQATETTRRYWMELPETESFNFRPGQFITFDLPIHEQKNKRWRSYSIASMPDGSNIVELVIVHLNNGLGSAYIFDEISEGSELIVRGPQGVFTLPENFDKDYYFICTGTGIAPFRSMLEYIHHHHIPTKKLHLIFGTRTKKDILYEAEMKEFTTKLPQFSYHVALSREDTTEYHKGYLHDIYEAIADPTVPSRFMLCGWRPMVDEAKQRLRDKGFDHTDIREELYG